MRTSGAVKKIIDITAEMSIYTGLVLVDILIGTYIFYEKTQKNIEFNHKED